MTLGGYRVERLLGRGGMGVVYEAVQVSLDRRVALKVLRPELAEDAAFVDRIRREGEVQASLEHPHVLDVYEVGESRTACSSRCGSSRAPPSPSCCATAASTPSGRCACSTRSRDALDAAHEAGLLHRDVKPQNVLVAEDDNAFLADFGLSRAATDTATASRSTRGHGRVRGTRGHPRRAAQPRHPIATRSRPPSSTASRATSCSRAAPTSPSSTRTRASRRPASARAGRSSRRRSTVTSRRRWPRIRRSGPRAARALVAAVREAIGDKELPAPGAAPAAGGPSAATGARAGPPGRRPRAAARGARRDGRGRRGARGGGGRALRTTATSPPRSRCPAVAKGAQALGSDLGAPDRSLDCRGDRRARAPASPARSCRPRAPGAQLIAPADGTIVAWSVRGGSRRAGARRDPSRWRRHHSRDQVPVGDGGQRRAASLPDGPAGRARRPDRAADGTAAPGSACGTRATPRPSAGCAPSAASTGAPTAVREPASTTRCWCERSSWPGASRPSRRS